MNKMWKTKNGKYIDINKMETGHIKNCIKCIENGKIKFTRIIDLGYTGDGNGDGRIFEQYHDINEKNEWLKTFNEELLRRKLGG